MRPLIALLLLTPALAGCLDGSDDALDPSATDGAAGELAILPEGLVMEGAEVVEYTQTSVTWTWEGTLGPGGWTPATGPEGDVVATTFEVPAGLAFNLATRLTWVDDGATHLGVALLDATGSSVCSDVRTNPTVPGEASCSTPAGPLGSSEKWTARAESWISARTETPFTLELTLATIEPMPSGPPDWTPCEHPWPCTDGTEWPLDLEGPFELLKETQLEIASHDDVPIHGWLWLPDLPEGVGAPVIITASPYLGGDAGAAELARYRTAALEQYVPNGFAYLVTSVRGTGGSGGCFTNEGPDERQDHTMLVEWAAEQPWSNGRVAMTGISYMGQTALHAAFAAPEALKTILLGAAEVRYHAHHTPQGAPATNGMWYETGRRVSAGQGALSGDPAQLIASIDEAGGRLCPATVENIVVTPRGQWTDDRTSWWKLRENYRHFPNITAGTWVYQGFQDLWTPWGQDVAWQLIPDTPKSFEFGQWGHELPPRESWPDERVAWFDFWLKGVGPVPDDLGSIDYEDADGRWHRSSAWPPAEARHEALYLAQGALAVAPRAGPSEYASQPMGPNGPPGALCPDESASSSAVAFLSEPLDSPSLVAGNPYAYLTLEADEPGGLIGVWLLATDSAGDCRTAEILTAGAADLRFHAGNYDGRDFPIDEPTEVRVDMTMLAEHLEAGERLAIVVAHPGPWELPADSDPNRIAPGFFPSSGRFSQAHMPSVTVHGGTDGHASHVALPFVEGGLGAAPATIEHPPRPFVPEVTP